MRILNIYQDILTDIFLTKNECELNSRANNYVDEVPVNYEILPSDGDNTDTKDNYYEN